MQDAAFLFVVKIADDRFIYVFGPGGTRSIYQETCS
jgi:hypothetical protein